MKKALLIASVLLIAVISTACINNIAVQELNNKATEFMQKGNYEEAVSRLEASIDLDSTMYETYYNLGVASTKAKKYEKAINAFQNGLKINDQFFDFYYSLAVAQYSYAEELLSTDSVEENQEETTESNNTKTISEEDKQKSQTLKEEALSNFKKYLELCPNASERNEVEELIKELSSDKKENTVE